MTMERVQITLAVTDAESFIEEISRIRAVGEDGNIEANGYAYYEELLKVEKVD